MGLEKTLEEIKKEYNGNWAGVVDAISKVDDPICRLRMYGEISPFKIGEKIYNKVAGEIRRATDEVDEHKYGLEQMANEDALTSLHNRRFYDEYIKDMACLSDRTENPLSLISFDVDKFKTFNDVYGHAAGDYVLRQLGEIAKKSTRGSDVCCRYGGEEFSIILPDTNEKGAYIVAEKLRKEIENADWTYNGRNLGKVTISLGVAEYSSKKNLRKDVETLEKHADDALYEAKKDGRNRVEVYGDTRNK